MCSTPSVAPPAFTRPPSSVYHPPTHPVSQSEILHRRSLEPYTVLPETSGSFLCQGFSTRGHWCPDYQCALSAFVPFCSSRARPSSMSFQGSPVRHECPYLHCAFISEFSGHVASSPCLCLSACLRVYVSARSLLTCGTETGTAHGFL